ncbi:hypothetical protein K1T71_014608 [Dendrolimus kikuchii]|uniref:Uncharacterized protein n=1 Tax=Dendrolimus kikuchii TaxID=765133 RepID=A0ACC1CEX5_9NEOP|nr:hypothetical protein K1T71_014608 [Dendrolimus kikuchii]
MDVDIFTSWVSQPDVCRCCLSTTGCFDVTESFYTESGVLELYADMLFECYGIKLSYLMEWGPSRLMCSSCVQQLRNAYNFKKQVKVAEKHFIEYFSKKAFTKSYEFPVHLQIVVSEDKQKEKVVPAQEKKLIILVPKRKLEDTNLNEDVSIPKKVVLNLANNIPLAKLAKDTVNIKEIKNVSDTSNVEQVKNIKTVRILKQPSLFIGPPQPKQLSERKRIIITCETILKDTTACPFRHHKSWFQCFFCAQDFMEINTLREHTLTTHQNINEEIKNIKRFPRSLQIEISNLKCRQCDLALTDVNSLRGHFVDVHRKIIYKECIADFKVNCSPYSCHLCERQFHVFRTLTTHLNEHYANCICDICGKSFLNSKRLKVHKRTHEHGTYPCKECGKVLKTKTSKANHMESAHSKRLIKCQICFEPMKHYNERVKHMSLVHNITHKFTCPICSREYSIKHYLATHMRQTHGHKNKKCAECGMAFVTNHGLKKHMLKHSGVKAFSCDVCCKTYARLYTLREHMRSHETEKVGAHQ